MVALTGVVLLSQWEDTRVSMPVSQALQTGPSFIHLLPLCGEGLSWQNFKCTHEFTELLYKEANTQNIKHEAYEEHVNRQCLLPLLYKNIPLSFALFGYRIPQSHV